EAIHPDAATALAEAGFDVVQTRHSPPFDDLAHVAADAVVLGVRSRTPVDARLLEACPSLLAVGAFCVGTEQIDLTACRRRGVAVFNAPYSNTRSVVELALGEMIMLLRGVFGRSNDLHAGKWTKSADGCREIRGKRLGIVGYGSIGSQLSVLAEALGMDVVYYDIAEKLSLGNAKKVPFEELLATSDVVSLHVDGRPGNRGFFGEREIGMMKPGAVLLNLSRGFVVDLDALARALMSKHLAGVAIDVFLHEPAANGDPFDCPLQGLPNVILTPHIGGSTEEAQQNIGRFVTGRLLDYLRLGSTSASVNLPVVHPPRRKEGHRIAHLHDNVPGMLARLNDTFARRGINITGQHLDTRGDVGYAIVDFESDEAPALAADVAALPGTIFSRLVY
ncbi:MAG: phosphoglycerate dehydrogenase, partial [Anaerolineae bacterium]|nr:phosphoglycerate dehydrogenase [Thermoflexales bacterium]MDW8408534.1 phosphoglycerate dehydrogenase [Anaerolineae bacterium]